MQLQLLATYSERTVRSRSLGNKSLLNIANQFVYVHILINKNTNIHIFTTFHNDS